MGMLVHGSKVCVVPVKRGVKHAVAPPHQGAHHVQDDDSEGTAGGGGTCPRA